MKYKILCTAPFKKFPKVMDLFNEAFDGDVFEYMPYDEILQSIHLYDGMIPNARIPFDKPIINNAIALKALYQPSMGYEHIDIDYLKLKSIDFNSLGLDHAFKETLWSTAEHTLSLMLSLLKNNYQSISEVKEHGKWDNRLYKITDLRNLNLGIIGFGNIGKKVAYLANCFGANVSAYDPYINNSDFPKYVSRENDLKKLLFNSDMITLHVPSNKETLGLLGEEEINSMKDGSYLVNSSRGGIVDEKALMSAVESKKVIGVALDVLDGESPYGVHDQPFVRFSKSHNNIIITPHLGGSSFPYMESIFMHSINELKSMIDRQGN